MPTPSLPDVSRFPTTRYQGSKIKLLDWIWDALSSHSHSFETCLDLFAGTSAVSYMLKCQGKQVHSNDKLKCNATIARALVQNNQECLALDAGMALFVPVPGRRYETLIADTFGGLFYPDEENKELDVVIQNIHADLDGYPQDLALFALYQACLVKRPFSLFHRANLSLRTADVKRSFGNKTTWEKPFTTHFTAALKEANTAVFDNGKIHSSTSLDFREVPGEFDLVYVDPPYFNAKGTGVNYLDFYHFLEGLTEYDTWSTKLTRRYKHIPYARETENPWIKHKQALGAFDDILARYASSIIAISYRSEGIPSLDELQALLKRHGRKDIQCLQRTHKYVLSTKRNSEVLLLSKP